MIEISPELRARIIQQEKNRQAEAAVSLNTCRICALRFRTLRAEGSICTTCHHERATLVDRLYLDLLKHKLLNPQLEGLTASGHAELAAEIVLVARVHAETILREIHET